MVIDSKNAYDKVVHRRMLNKLVEQGTLKDIIDRIQKIKSIDLWKSFFHSLFEGIIINL